MAEPPILLSIHSRTIGWSEESSRVPGPKRGTGSAWKEGCLTQFDLGPSNPGAGVMYGLMVRARVAIGRQQEFLQSLRSFASKARQDFQAQEHAVLRPVESVDEFMILGTWSEAQARERYMQSEGYATLLGAIQVLGRLDEVSTFEGEAESWNTGGSSC